MLVTLAHPSPHHADGGRNDMANPNHSGKRAMYRPHKTPEHQLTRARQKWHEQMAAMTPEQKAAYKAEKAAYAKQWRARTKDTPTGEARRQRAWARYRRPGHSAKVKLKSRESRLIREYGITEEWFQAKLAAQNGLCYLCHRPPGSRGKLAIDHCHRTGRVRHLLCDSCNVCIAGFEKIAERC